MQVGPRTSCGSTIVYPSEGMLPLLADPYRILLVHVNCELAIENATTKHFIYSKEQPAALFRPPAVEGSGMLGKENRFSPTL